MRRRPDATSDLAFAAIEVYFFVSGFVLASRFSRGRRIRRGNRAARFASRATAPLRLRAIRPERARMAKVLCIDDDRIAIAVAMKIAENAGYEVVGRLSAEGLEAVLEAERPDAVVLDLLMPGSGGDEARARIRRAIGPDLPIVVSSATHLRLRLPPDPNLAYCPKPLDPALFAAELARLIGAGPSRGPEGAP